MGPRKLPHKKAWKTRIAIAAGGTGGHIVPAIAFAEWVNRYRNKTEVRFYCGSRPLEKEIFFSREIVPKVLPVDGSPLSGTICRRVVRFFGLCVSTFLCLLDFVSWRPDACLLFGGYASLPALLAARMLRIPVQVHEQNAVAGKVTRLAASWGVRVFSGWNTCKGLEAGAFHHTGIPTRFFRYLPLEDAWLKLNCKGKPPDGPKVLVIGGSLASSAISSVAQKLAELPQFRSWVFFVLGGKQATKRTDNVIFVSRTWDMSPLYSLADCAISRGGASTLAELALFGIPSIVVPWKEAADDHQTENAKIFADMGYGDTWDDKVDDLVTLAERLQKLPALGSRISTDDLEQVSSCVGKAIWDGVFPEGRCCR
ncbi:MAG: UDP-N-acetylglucosamine--N-acetylmuramyl-(pentapeptide) pyrophosphoryl-undecaprenol N-acetylglucosamine transferase [Thermovirgaceae bacterium]